MIHWFINLRKESSLSFFFSDWFNLLFRRLAIICFGHFTSDIHVRSACFIMAADLELFSINTNLDATKILKIVQMERWDLIFIMDKNKNSRKWARMRLPN